MLHGGDCRDHRHDPVDWSVKHEHDAASTGQI